MLYSNKICKQNYIHHATSDKVGYPEVENLEDFLVFAPQSRSKDKY